MDLAKLPFEKMFSFIAGIIPGSAAVFIYYLANPLAFRMLMGPNGLGYSTKVCVLLSLCFVIGNSITMFIFALGGAVGGVSSQLGRRNVPQWPEVRETAPWRDPQWRKLAKTYLGESAPDDTLPMSTRSFQIQKNAIANMPEAEKHALELELFASKSALASNDVDWSNWYSHLNRLRQVGEKPDSAQYVNNGLRASLQATAIYLALSMPFVPKIRSWFCMAFCSIWLLLLVAEVYAVLTNANNPWYTWAGQLDYLAKANRQFKVPNAPAMNDAKE